MAGLSLRQIPGIDRLIRVEDISIISPPINSTAVVGVPTFQNRNQWIRPRRHQKHLLRRQVFRRRFSPSTGVCVREIRIEHRKGNELPERSLERMSGLRCAIHGISTGTRSRHSRSACPGPLIRFAKRQGAKEIRRLRLSRHSLRAVHVREGVQNFLGAVRQLALRLFEIRIVTADAKSARPRKAQLRRLERRRDDVALTCISCAAQPLPRIRFEVAFASFWLRHLLQPLL